MAIDENLDEAEQHLLKSNDAVGPLITEAPSIVDLLQQDYNELAAIENVIIPIAGYEKSGLAAKYGLPEYGKQLDEISRKVMREVKDTYSRNLLIAQDVMISLCQGMYCKLPDDPDYTMLDFDKSGVPVLYDERLAAMLPGDPPDSARGIVRRLFNNNDMALLAHATKLQLWLQNTKADISMEFWQMGE